MSKGFSDLASQLSALSNKVTALDPRAASTMELDTEVKEIKENLLALEEKQARFENTVKGDLAKMESTMNKQHHNLERVGQVVKQLVGESQTFKQSRQKGS